MTLVGYIDSTGIHIPTYPEVIEDLKEEFRAIFGADVYLEADSQEGQMLAMVAAAINDSNQLAVAVFNSYSPQGAQGEGLSRSVKINGISRHKSSVSSVDLTIVGTAGTIITGGMAADSADQKWILPPTVTIPLGGEITVTATAQKAGAVKAGAGEVNVIATPKRGWQSVTNPLAAKPGTDVENDALLRVRQRTSTALPSKTVVEGIVGALFGLEGVTKVEGYENDSNEVDADGVPANNLAFVVAGGEAAEVANAIAIKKTPGVPTFGTTTVPVTDKYGMPSTIKFFRPTEVSLDVAVTIKPKAGFVSTTGDAIEKNLDEYLNGLKIGEDVLLSKLYTPINAAEPVADKRSFDVTSLTMAKHSQAQSAANVGIAFTEVAVVDVANITLTVQE